MIAVKQRFVHRPHKGVYADCHRAVLASLLEMNIDTVPHFCQDNPSIEEHNRRIDEWLGARNLAQAGFPLSGTLSDTLLSMAVAAPRAYWMLTGRTKGGFHHSVVCLGGQIVHDPSPDKRVRIVAPCADGNFWATLLVVKDPAQYVSLSPVVRRNRFREAWEFFCAIWW